MRGRPIPSVVHRLPWSDGWRVIKYPDLRPPSPGQEYDLSYLEFEFVLEKLEAIDGKR